MKVIFLLNLLVALFVGSYSLHTTISPFHDFCVYKKVADNDKLNINYISSGQDEQRVSLKVFDLQGNVLREISDQREGNTDIMISVGGSYRICWRSLDSNPKTVSFDLTIGDKADKQAAPTDNLDQVSQEVRKAYKSLEQIFRNQHYQHTREGVHREAIEGLESKIQWCAIIKILVLILIAVVQVYILTGYFKSRKEFAV